MWAIVGALVVGCVIGPLARLILPGKQNISLPMTVILGAAGSLSGSAIYTVLADRDSTSAFNPMGFGIGVAVAVVLVLLYSAVVGRRRANRE